MFGHIFTAQKSCIFSNNLVLALPYSVCKVNAFSHSCYHGFQDFKFLHFLTCFIIVFCWHRTFTPGEVVLCCAKSLGRAFTGFQKCAAVNENSVRSLGWKWQNCCVGTSWSNLSAVGLNRRPLIIFSMPNLIPFNHLKQLKVHKLSLIHYLDICSWFS